MRTTSKFRTALGVSGISGLLFLLCSGNPAPQAGGLETTNGLAVCIEADGISGKASSPAMIIVSDTACMPEEIGVRRFADTVFTAEDSTFKITGLPEGTFNIVATTSDHSGGCILRDIRLSPSRPEPRNRFAAFGPVSSLTVKTLIDTVPQRHAVVYIRGTTFSGKTSADGTCTIGNLPGGTYAIEATLLPQKIIETIIYTARAEEVTVATAAEPLVLTLEPTD